MQSDIVQELWDRAYSSKVPDALSERAGQEIMRLRKIIDDYAIICKSYSKELRRLNDKHAPA